MSDIRHDGVLQWTLPAQRPADRLTQSIESFARERRDRNRTRPRRAPDGRSEIDLVGHDDCFHGAGAPCRQHLPLFGPQASPGVEHEDDQIGLRRRHLSPTHPLGFDRVAGATHPCGVDHRHRDAVEVDGFLERVARGPRHGGYDRPIASEESIENRRLPDARHTGQRHTRALSHDAAAVRLVEKRARRRERVREDADDAPRRQMRFGLVGELDGSLPASDELDQGLDQRGDPPGQRTIHLGERDASLVDGPGRDEVADGFCPGEIETPPPQRPVGEFARAGKRRPPRHGRSRQRVEHGRAAMRPELDGGFACERALRREDDEVAVIQRLTVAVDERAETGTTVAGELAPFSREEQRSGDRVRVGPGDPDAADAAASRRSCHCREGRREIVHAFSRNLGRDLLDADPFHEPVPFGDGRQSRDFPHRHVDHATLVRIHRVKPSGQAGARHLSGGLTDQHDELVVALAAEAAAEEA